MTTADDFLSQIDTALDDYDVGPDAMRCTPDGVAAVQSPPVIRIRVDATATEARLARLREVQQSLQQMAEAFGPAAENAAKGLAAFSQAFRAPRRADGRPAWQSAYGPARRRR